MVFALGISGEQKVFEEEGRKLSASRQTGLPIDRDRMLANRALTPVEYLRHLPVPEPFEDEERHLPLGGCQRPTVELSVDLGAETLEELHCA